LLLALRALPPRVALFQWRARRLASRLGDDFGPLSATRPEKLAALLTLARDRRRVVELGTACGWTAISLALADRTRVVTSYDPIERSELDHYLSLVGPRVRRRLMFIRAPGADGPRSDGIVELLYVDSTHELEDTVREVRAWLPALAYDALLVFDDFTHPDYPGVREALEELKLDGEEYDGMFVHRRRPSRRSQRAQSAA
jgi:predicted O-methyltransferase YrrM